MSVEHKEQKERQQEEVPFWEDPRVVHAAENLDAATAELDEYSAVVVPGYVPPKKEDYSDPFAIASRFQRIHNAMGGHLNSFVRDAARNSAMEAGLTRKEWGARREEIAREYAELRRNVGGIDSDLRKRAKNEALERLSRRMKILQRVRRATPRFRVETDKRTTRSIRMRISVKRNHNVMVSDAAFRGSVMNDVLFFRSDPSTIETLRKSKQRRSGRLLRAQMLHSPLRSSRMALRRAKRRRVAARSSGDLVGAYGEGLEIMNAESRATAAEIKRALKNAPDLRNYSFGLSSREIKSDLRAVGSLLYNEDESVDVSRTRVTAVTAGFLNEVNSGVSRKSRRERRKPKSYFNDQFESSARIAQLDAARFQHVEFRRGEDSPENSVEIDGDVFNVGEAVKVISWNEDGEFETIRAQIMRIQKTFLAVEDTYRRKEHKVRFSQMRKGKCNVHAA